MNCEWEGGIRERGTARTSRARRDRPTFSTRGGHRREEKVKEQGEGQWAERELFMRTTGLANSERAADEAENLRRHSIRRVLRVRTLRAGRR